MNERGDVQADRRDGEGTAESADGDLRREVVVPMELYKVVTVFSTLAAVALVVGGMVMLDLATHGTAPREEVELLTALAGVAAVVAGAAVYAFASRFRAAGMGNPEEDDGENSN